MKELKKITITAIDLEDTLVELLNYIKTNGNTGHSFSIVVDPKDENEKIFGWDGDGGDSIQSVEVEEVPETIKELQDTTDYFNPKVEKLQEDITLDIDKGDEILMGKFLNKRVKVKSITNDGHGMPQVNGKPITRVRLPKIQETLSEKIIREYKQPYSN